jgi:hypothetical protein
VVVDRAIVAWGGDLRARWLGAGLLAASAYPAHYLLAAPGMFADAAFLLGFAIVLYGFALDRPWLVVAALAGATLARQTAVPVALAAALWLVASRRGERRLWLAPAAAFLVPLAVYAALHQVASRFAQADDLRIARITVIGALDDPRALGEHAARTLLGILVPVAAVTTLAARRGRHLPCVPLLLAGTIVAETLALGPDWTAGNEPRLAALSLPALAVAGGLLVQQARLRRAGAVTLTLSVAAASLHHLYSRLPTDRPAAWVAVSLLAALAVVASLVASARPPSYDEPARPKRSCSARTARST